MFHPNTTNAVLAGDEVGLALEATLGSIKTAVQLLDNFISGTRGLVTEDNSAAIKTALQIIDNFISGTRGLVTEDNAAAIKTNLDAATDFEGGPVTVGSTAVEITFTGTPKAILITADHDNAGDIYLGKSNVASDGSNAMVRLAAGESTGWDYNDTANAVWMVATQASQTVLKLALLA